MAQKRGKKRRQQQDYGRKIRKVRRKIGLALTPDLMEIEDLREWHPRGPLRDYRQVDERPAEIKEGYKKATIGHQYFEEPRLVAICKRRRERRESLFRLRKIGKGKAGPKKRLRTLKSDIRCK